MRLTTTNKKSTPKSWLFPVALIGTIVLLLSADVIWKKEEGVKEVTKIYCDAEQVKDGRFVNGSLSFGGGAYQSSAEARSGKYACRLTKENRYGMQYQKVNPPPSGSYRVSVWRYATAGHQGFLAMEMQSNGNIIERKQEGVATEEKEGWERLELFFELPDSQLVDTLKIYVYVDERSGNTYFDDLAIEYSPPNKKSENLPFSPDRLDIRLEKKAYRKLDQQRWQAF
ncbi:MAG: hypothetical protein AAFP82_10525, partial [Bacteroidota bacterium]